MKLLSVDESSFCASVIGLLNVAGKSLFKAKYRKSGEQAMPVKLKSFDALRG